MKLAERSYSSKMFRPRPEIHTSDDGNLIVIATPWGPRGPAKKATQVMVDYLNSVQQDSEATSPFAMLTCLSPRANYLRIAIKLANDIIYNEENKNEYISGVELFALLRSPDEFVWAQIGYPYAILDRGQKPLVNLGTQHDLVVEYSKYNVNLSPLPNKMLGLDPSSDFSVESFHPLAGDRLILLARSGLPNSLYQLPSEKRDLNTISNLLAKDDENLPFWIGTIELNT